MRHLLLGLLLPFSALQASGSGKGHSAQTPEGGNINQPLSATALRGTQRAIFQRVIQARLFQSGTWTLADPSQTPVTAARTIASLGPSFLTGLLHLPDRGYPSNAEVDAFQTVRTSVLSAAKGCRFDIVINAGAERSGELFVRHLAEISVRLHPDAWTFHVASDGVELNPEVIEDGIAWVHTHGQMVGYDGPLSLIPEGVDYIMIRAWNFSLDRRQIEILRAKQRVPLLVELPTSFGNQPQADCSAYTESMKTAERSKTLILLAENQGAWGYHFAYPVFYPVLPNRRAFDATKEAILMVTIRSLLARFN